jgi:beta-mannosidase
VAASTPELDRLGGDRDLDDSGWAAAPVPGHWAQAEGLGDVEGPVLYRRRFTHPEPGPGRRLWLVVEGILSQGDVWLDGGYLGDTDGYFVAHRFEVTAQLRAGTDHVLAVGVSCPRPRPDRSKRELTGSLQVGPLAPTGCPGGIWRPVHLVETGPVAVRHARVVCLSATADRAELGLRAVLDSPAPTEVTVETVVRDPGGMVVVDETTVRPLATGENRLAWRAIVTRPHRWWPAALGDQPRYEVTVRVLVGGAASDQRRWLTGLRRVELDDFVCRVNGERLFLKGVALGPASAHLGSLEPEVLARELRAARDAGFDLVRVHGHVSRPEVYDTADELGLLLWQDLPLVEGYAISTRAQARRLAREAVDLLGHHPSVALWCAHEEPNGPPVPAPSSEVRLPVRTVAARLARHLAPSWNRSVLDPLLRRELRANDRSRPVVTHSGMLPHPLRLTGTDTHLWLGWRVGREADLARVVRRWPRLGRFVGGFGAQSVGAGAHPYGTLRLRGAERGSFERYLPRDAYTDGRDWAQATRTYQAAVLRSHIETLRRLKYRPTGGFCAFALADTEAAVGYGLLDAERRPKPAYDAAVDACRPVVVVADPPPQLMTPGQQLDLAVHAVSDLRHPLDPVRVTARATLGAHQVVRAWEGRLEADSCAFVGRLRTEVPAANGTLWVDLELEADGHVATNRYQAVVIPTSEAAPRTAGAGSS